MPPKKTRITLDLSQSDYDESHMFKTRLGFSKLVEFYRFALFVVTFLYTRKQNGQVIGLANDNTGKGFKEINLLHEYTDYKEKRGQEEVSS